MVKILESEYVDNRVRLSMENIASQVGDKEIEKIQRLMDELIEVGNHYTNQLGNGISYFRLKQTKHIISEMERLLTRRFGVTFKMVNMDGMVAAVHPVPPINDNVINPNVDETYAMISDYLNVSECEDGDCDHIKRPRDVKDIRDIRDYTMDEKSIVWKLWDSFNKMSKALNTDGVTVDLEKAMLNGLPKEYTIFVLVDFNLCITKYGLKSRELMGIILHEVGHAFTHIEQSYRTVKTTSVLLDTMRNEIGKGKSYTETLKIMYKKMDGKEDISDSNATVATLKVMNLYMDKTSVLDMGNVHSVTDSEQVADMFATRFGYGGELVRGIERVTHHNYNVLTYIQRTAIYFFFITLYSTLEIVTAITTAILAPIALILLAMLQTRILDLIIPNKYNGETYDKLRIRYKRIKLDMVRQIRASDLPKDVIRVYIKEYEYIDKLMSGIDKDLRLTQVLASMTPWNKGGIRRKLLEQTIEDLMENRLHIDSANIRSRIE